MSKSTSVRRTGLVARFLRSHRRHESYLHILAVAALFVAVGTAFTLRMSGITLTRTETVLDCQYNGNGAHTHSESCYDADGNLVCPLQERPLHVHTPECYATGRELACGLEESDGHQHGDECYDEEGNLTCTTPAGEGAHQHTDACYRDVQTDQLICGFEEVTEQHVHTDACFRTVTVEEPDPEPEPAADETAPAADPEPAAEEPEPAPAADPEPVDVVPTDPQPADPAAGQDPAEPAYPKQNFDKRFLDADENEVLRVEVEAPEGALPEGTTMVAEWVDPASVQRPVERVAAAKDPTREVWYVQGVRITFYDRDGKRVQPLAGSRVTLTVTSSLVDTAEDAAVRPYVLRLQDDLHKPITTEEEDAARPAEVLDRLTDEQLAAREVVLASNQLVFDAQYFCSDDFAESYLVAYTTERAKEPAADEPADDQGEPADDESPDADDQVDNPEDGGDSPEGDDTDDAEDERDAPEGDDTDADNPDDPGDEPDNPEPDNPEPAEPSYPAQSFKHRFSDRFGSLVLRVEVNAPEGAFPENTTMVATWLDPSTVEGTVADAVAQAEGQGKEVAAVQAVDITFRDAQGAEVEPLVPVTVTLTPGEESVPEEAEGQLVVHVDDAGAGEVVAQLSEEELAEREIDASGDQLVFDANAFSVYAIAYTVDFHWEVNGESFEYSIPGGGFVSFRDLVGVLGIAADDPATDADEVQELLDGIESITFSNPELVSVSKVEQDTTVGAIKGRLGLECEYSAGLTEEEIEEVDAQAVRAGDWALISLKPFDTEESLTVSMKNGDMWTLKVTDEQVTSLGNIDEDKSYVIYTESNGQIYVLKTDGSTVTAQRSDLDGMDNDYKWKFDFVYTDINTGISYYIIRPCDNSAEYLYLSWDTTFTWSNPNNVPLVQRGSGNVMVIPNGNGTFRFEGYNNTKLVLDGGWFAGRRGSSYNNIVIYEQGQISQYRYNVTTDDYAMGKVCGWNEQNQYKEDAEFDAVTNNQKTNQQAITAQPQSARYMFDYWDLNGTPLDFGATIPANALTIPYQGSKLTAHFKKDPNWQASDEEKEGRVIDKESFQAWLNELRDRNIPLDQDKCTKTAEVYDYENRIYRVDLTAKSNLSMFDGDIDLGFIIDVSGSMQFPSKLVPVAGKESIDVGHINDNYYTQHQLDTNKVYYIVVDRTNTANVLRLKWCGGTNPAYSNRTGWPTGNPNSSSTTWHTGWGICGLGYEESALDGATRYFTDTSNALFAGDNGPFQIYEAGDNGKRRREYLESSIAGTISELNNILGDLAYAKNAGEAADVKIAYNTFADAVDYDHTNHNFVSVTSGLSIGYDYKGGTDTEEALNDARDFFWNDSATKVAVLITDGAPQQSGVDGPTLDARVKAAADALKNEEGVKLITIGLSMGDVKRGSRLLYDIATKDSDGDPYFYKAETGDELQYALYEVIQQVMADAIVVGNVTDTVNEAFYPVDKDTGLPLIAGNVIDLNGNKIANSVSGLTDEQKAAGYGVIGTDDSGSFTVTWSGQNFTWDGWHGTVYEKAKEDFLGGNAVRTNDPENPAKIESVGYKIHPEDPTIEFKDEIKEQGTKSLETPRVNVNELDLTDNNTEWTVYLGTNVDPKSQLEALYDSILVKEVVTAATDTDGDGFPDRMTGTSLYYPLLESFRDDRESSGTGERVTFKMKDLLKKLNNGNEITVDDLIAAGEGGITLPYDLYGQDCPGTIKVTLKKTGQTADYDPHDTTVTGDAVEKYDLLIDFAPDYVHLPEGQGGDGSLLYHTGEYGLTYPGHAAGEDYSTNTHVINVYEVPLDVLKTDENDEPLSGAVFKLYKAGGSGTISGLSGSYTEVASGTSGTDGVAHLTFAAGMETGLVPGTTYYLVEDQAPENYTKVNTVWTVQVQTEIGEFTKLDGEVIYAPDYPTLDESMYPFNWDQGAKIVVDGQPVKAVVKGETAGSTAVITDGSYVSHKDAISFRHTVLNVRNDLEIEVNKIWQDENNPSRPSSVTVKLYRVSEKGHQWGNGTVVPCTCTTDGVKEYTCSVCGATDTHAIDAAGHKQGTPHRENYQAPTCTEPGSYDTVVRCTVCNAVLSSEHTEIPATGHTWVNQETTTSDPEHYCYDVADVCSVCGAVNDETRVHHDHDWGEWQVTTPAQPGVAGEETRICKHNPAHIDHREIPALSTDHTVTVYFRCTGNGGGQTSYPGQVTSLATRVGTGTGDMTIKWNWDQWTSPKPIIVDGLGSSTYTTSSSSSNNGAEQTLTVSNITSDLTLYVTIRNGGYMGTNDGLIGQPTFAGNRNLNASSSSYSRGLDGNSLLNASLAPNRGGEDSAAAIPAVLSGISGLKSKAEATCGDKYWEEVSGTYTITAAGNWTLSIPDLDRFNEDGKEYQYYVEEIDPPQGYEVTYTGQGAQQGDTVTVKNEFSQGSLLITKNVQYNGRTAATDEEKALVNGSYAFTVKKDGVEITGSPFTITVADGVSNSILIPDLEAGDYTIEETSSGNLTLVSVSGGKSVSSNIVTATVTVGKMTEADLLDTAKAEFTNNYVAYEVIIVKVDTANTETKLGGAKFDLYAEEAVENGEIKDGATPIRSGLISSSDEEDKGKVSLGTLTPGKYYLFETEAPSGYTAMDMPVEIIVSDNRVGLTQGSRNETSTIIQEKAELMVMNSSGVTLPEAGGPGTRIFTLIGSLMILAAGALAWRKRGLIVSA